MMVPLQFLYADTYVPNARSGVDKSVGPSSKLKFGSLKRREGIVPSKSDSIGSRSSI